MFPSEIKAGKTYVGKGGSLRKVTATRSGCDGKDFFDNVHFIIIKGRRPGMESVLSRKQFAHWALGTAIKEVRHGDIDTKARE
ncbi:hypothetical protein [Paenibacillus sp. Cedars]|uniref:hypothetical protein n=1 Tax=Paenibacillus sp. Cedars TaxID=1980674 RepID=UPI00116568A1|nr:hypothetical protein [Paenibacillus sp. Cedars]AWP28742.1 hypothetical protein B9D94_19855 [Paenibacillus sp. Cedars]